MAAAGDRGRQEAMEEDQRRPASRRFWEEGLATAVAPTSLSPPIQQRRRDVNIRVSTNGGLDRYRRRHRPPALVSRAKVSAAASGGGEDIDSEAKQGSSELSKLSFTVEDGKQCLVALANVSRLGEGKGNWVTVFSRSLSRYIRTAAISHPEGITAGGDPLLPHYP